MNYGYNVVSRDESGGASAINDHCHVKHNASGRCQVKYVGQIVGVIPSAETLYRIQEKSCKNLRHY